MVSLSLGELEFVEYVSNEFRRLICAVNPPGWPTRIELEYDIQTDRRVLRLRFDETNQCADIVIPRQLQGGRDYDQARLLPLWSRLYEDEALNRELRAARDRVMAQIARVQDPEAVGYLHQSLSREMEYIRRGHLGRGERAEARAPRVVPFPEAPVRRTGHTPLRHPGWQAAAELNALAQNEATAAAQTRGEQLLRRHLSPSQRADYDLNRRFDVVGCGSGKTYRINFGRQLNIFELDRRGRHKWTWCFLPSGGLCEADIMLGQKVALENFERQALEVANKFQPERTALTGTLNWPRTDEEITLEVQVRFAQCAQEQQQYQREMDEATAEMRAPMLHVSTPTAEDHWADAFRYATQRRELVGPLVEYDSSNWTGRITDE